MERNTHPGIYAVLGFCLVLSACGLRQTERATEIFPLPTGEVITNESFLSMGRDSVRHNNLFFQFSGTAPREPLGEIIEEDAGSISLRTSNLRLIRTVDRTALRIGDQVFLRWNRGKEIYWYHTSARPDPWASVFLRSFLAPGDFRIPIPPGTEVRGWFDVERPEVPYVFHELDLEGNVFTTRKQDPNAAYPEFLVYSSVRYGSPWRFDLERTRAANHLPPPSDAGVWIDYSIVIYPGELTLGDDRKSVLALPGAAEVYSRSMPLRSDIWTEFKCSFALPTGVVRDEHYEAMLAFNDPLPEYVSVFFRRYPVLWNEWFFVRVGDWVRAEASGYQGNVSRIVFIRVRKL